jgi:hypothetical protein
MQRAVETLGEVELLFVGEILVAEHQHGVLVHAGADRLQRRAIVHLAQVDRAHFAGEDGRERRDGDGHGCSSMENEGIILIEVRPTTNPDFLVRGIFCQAKARLGW